jgi:ABC-2 type transport system ATP-binding protein
VIEARELTQRYGAKTAVDDLTFAVQPGIVTGFPGSNGAGNSTTMRVIIGLDARVLEYHRRRTALPRLPGTTARGGGAAGGPVAAPGLVAFKHLLGLALTHGIARRRVDEVIALAGLEEVAPDT